MRLCATKRRNGRMFSMVTRSPLLTELAVRDEDWDNSRYDAGIVVKREDTIDTP